MRIGFVSTWFERGAAYVTKQYADLLEKEGHDIYIYARGESYAIGNPKWDLPNVEWGKKLYDTCLDFKQFSTWIKKNSIECVFFNEQRDMQSVIRLKLEFPEVKIGTYIDYYTQNTIKDFKYYDFLICNTKRHFSVFNKHKQCYYIPWGTDIDLYKFNENSSDQIRFFHSAGMSNRKGTDVLIDAFIDGELYRNSKLIIHTQIPIEKLTNYSVDSLNEHNISIIEKTVSAPGLYYMGDVYVYPTTLDGLGLTMYEALSSGLPVITTDCPPMNEVINIEVGRLVSVDDYKCRWDAYYWPLAYVNKKSLINSMKYYVDNQDIILQFRKKARKIAVATWNWDSRGKEVSKAFTESKLYKIDRSFLLNELKVYKKQQTKRLKKSLIPFMPNFLQQIYFRNR